ncbi:MAG: hypothetical protein ABR499_06480, partial [Gemmatimonadaceae bacterium]
VQRLHLVAGFPHPTIVDPRFAAADPRSPAYSTVVGYVHAGDAAIWTGHYLAAEAFRYAVTRSPDALANARRALGGIQGLVDVTTPAQPDLLARFLWPDNWEYADRIAAAEAGHGVYRGAPGGVAHRWLGNTTRDQYSGVLFGLSVAFDLIDQPDVRARAADLVTRLLGFLLRYYWSPPMPDGSFSTTFLQRPDQQLSFLQVGRRVNPARFRVVYQEYRTTYAAAVVAPITVDCVDPHRSYYKFNLNHINLYNLIRLEESGGPRTAYMNAFQVLRSCTLNHENAHFNLVERALIGPDAARDIATQRYLGLWLQRPRRDYAVDLRSKYPACGDNRACRVIPVNERPNTDFLWQRSPFLLQAGGDGTVETAGIDYLLSYWMARYYGLLGP